jgi:hypothetical protein
MRPTAEFESILILAVWFPQAMPSRRGGIMLVLILVAGRDAIDVRPDHFQESVLGIIRSRG